MTDREQKEPTLGPYDAKRRETRARGLGITVEEVDQLDAKRRETRARALGITVEEVDQLDAQERELDARKHDRFAAQERELDARGVIVTDVQMPFWSMVFLMVKFVIASIPAFIILAVLAYAFIALLGLVAQV